MNNNAEVNNARFAVEFFQGFQLENMFGKNDIGVAHQVFDRVCPQFPRPCGERRLGHRRPDRRKSPRPVEESGGLRVDVVGKNGGVDAGGSQYGFQPHPPARFGHRGAADAFGAGEINLFLRQQMSKVAGGNADGFFRQRQAELLFHRPRHPGTGRSGCRHGAFVDFADDDGVKTA